jgi:ATP dependent DNA ligase domain
LTQIDTNRGAEPNWKTPSASNKTKYAAAPNTFSLIEPMKAPSVPDLPVGRWLYEVKLDGYRALAFKSGRGIRLISRNQKTSNYPELLEALKLLPAGQAILDGEIAALDPKGRSFFQLLQAYEIGERRPPAALVATVSALERSWVASCFTTLGFNMPVLVLGAGVASGVGDGVARTAGVGCSASWTGRTA